MAYTPPNIEELQNHHQLRLISLILTGMNVIAGLITCGVVCWDACRACRRDIIIDPEKKGIGGSGSEKEQRGWWYQYILPKDIYPLLFGIIVVVQGMMLAVVESAGLEVGIGYDCRQLSEIAWTALWMVPFTSFLFASDGALRAMASSRRAFPPRSFFRLFVGTVALFLLLMGTWVVSRTQAEVPKDDICTGELMTFVDQFGAAAVGILAALWPLVLFMMVVIFLGIQAGRGVAENERVAASREFWFIGVGMIQWFLLLPNYALRASGQDVRAWSFVATIVINMSAIINAALHFYFRSMKESTPPPPEPPVTPITPLTPLTPVYQFKKPNINIHIADCMDFDEKSLPPAPASPFNPTPSDPRFSRSTMGSMQLRLGDEIANLMRQLLATTSRVPQTPPLGANPSPPNYSRFPPPPPPLSPGLTAVPDRDLGLTAHRNRNHNRNRNHDAACSLDFYFGPTLHVQEAAMSPALILGPSIMGGREGPSRASTVASYYFGDDDERPPMPPEPIELEVLSIWEKNNRRSGGDGESFKEMKSGSAGSAPWRSPRSSKFNAI